MNNRTTFLLLILLLAFSIFIRMPFISVPFERDEGVRAAIAQGMIEEGKLPYKDLYTNKPPLVLFIYILIFKLFGQTIEAVHLFMYLYTLMTVIMTFILAKVFTKDNIASLVSAFSISVMTISPKVLGNAANLEIFMILPLIISVILLYKGLEQRSMSLFFLSSIFTGMAFWIKQSAIFNLLFLIVVIYYEFFIRKAVSKTYALKMISSILGGFIITFLIMGGYFLCRGILNEAIFWIFKAGVPYMKYPFIFSGFYLVIKNIIMENPILWIFAAISFIYFLRKQDRISGILILWFLFSFLATIPGFRFYSHYYIQLLPPVALLSGFAAYKIRTSIKRLDSNILKHSLTVIVPLLMIFSPLKANYNYLFKYTPYEISKEIYVKNPFCEAYDIAKYIKENTTESDSILVYGDEPEIYFYSKRKSATRHIGFFYILRDYSYASKMQREAYSEIEKNNPAYIVWFLVPPYSLMAKDKYIIYKLKNLILKEYKLVSVGITKDGKSIYYFGEDSFSQAQGQKGTEMIYFLFKRKERE